MIALNLKAGLSPQLRVQGLGCRAKVSRVEGLGFRWVRNFPGCGRRPGRGGAVAAGSHTRGVAALRGHWLSGEQRSPSNRV